jgi:hypothetical protein
MSNPVLVDVLRDIGERHGVCVRPIALKRFHYTTREMVGWIDVPCGSRLSALCKPCANRNRRLRQRQIEEG